MVGKPWVAQGSKGSEGRQADILGPLTDMHPDPQNMTSQPKIGVKGAKMQTKREQEGERERPFVL